jgi:hypothetical protein
MRGCEWTLYAGAQVWDATDGQWEREYERQQRLKAEAAKQAAIEAEAEALKQRLAALAAQQAAGDDEAGPRPDLQPSTQDLGAGSALLLAFNLRSITTHPGTRILAQSRRLDRRHLCPAVGLFDKHCN